MKYLRFLLVLSALAIFTTHSHAEISVSGTFQKWQPLTLDVFEPDYTTSELAVNPNPFLDIALDITFISPSGETFTVPGFFAGDGNGNGSGAVWRVRFSPNESGTWTYRVSFNEGNGIAVGMETGEQKALPSDGQSGQFEITSVAKGVSGFSAWGRLGYDGHHYLKFADGGYWIKGGIDSPENFFGFAGFDNTTDNPGGAGSDGLLDGIHRYEPHVKDWREGDPDFQNSETGYSGRGIIGAINYLSEQKVNSLYFLPMNLGGDGRETFPFIDNDGSYFSNTHYDISKLHQWNIVLNHMQNKNIAAHLVLAEQEEGNTNWLDNGHLATERKLYYRELIARFGYLLALKWNLSEESRYGTKKHKEFAKYIRNLDWADHPIAVHTDVNKPEERYKDLLGDTSFDATSIQYSPKNANDYVETWRQKSEQAGWPWVVDMDENAPAREGLTDSNADELRKSVLYPVYFSGGNIEWYFGYHALPLGGDMRTENFRTRESMYRYMRYAREFMLSELPFHEMEPADHLHSEHDDSGIQVFAKTGEYYAVYLPDGTVQGELAVEDGTYSARWFNPVSGQFEGDEKRLTGKNIRPGLPPGNQDQDWVLLLKNALLEIPEQAGQEEEPELGAAEAQPQQPTGNQESGNTEETADTPFFGGDSATGSLNWLILMFLMIGALRRIVIADR